MRSKWSLPVYLSLVFVSGAGVGVFGHRLFTAQTVIAKRPPFNHSEARKRYIDDHQSRLKLTDGQVTKLTTILDETRGRYKQARDKMDPEMKRIQQDQRNQTREILTPEQRVEYEKMLEERDSKRRHSQPPGC